MKWNVYQGKRHSIQWNQIVDTPDREDAIKRAVELWAGLKPTHRRVRGDMVMVFEEGKDFYIIVAPPYPNGQKATLHIDVSAFFDREGP